MKKVIVLIGNIGAGKSTFTQYLRNDCVIINPDAIRYSLGAGEYQYDEQTDYIVLDAAMSLLTGYLWHDVNIVYDSSGMTVPKYRSNVLNKVKQINLALPCNMRKNAVAVVFPKLTMKKSVDRRMRDPHGDYDRKRWNSVWRKFNEGYQFPTLDEGFYEIIDLSCVPANDFLKEFRRWVCDE